MPDEPPRDGFDDMVSRLKAEKTKKPDLKLVPAAPPMRLLHGDEIRTPISAGTVIRGFLHRGSLTLVYGPPKSGKSFLVTDAFLSVSAGDEYWMGHKVVRPGPVLYVGCEGFTGMWKRAEAAVQHRGLAHVPNDFWFAYGRPQLVRLGGGGHLVTPHAEEILALIERVSPAPVAVAIDTVFRAIGGGNVNNSDHVNALLAAIGKITDLGIAVLAVHHEIKSGGTPAGSVSLIGGADTIVRTQTLDDGDHAWEVEFAKDDAADPAPHKFALKVIDVGVDPDGEPAISCVVQAREGAVEAAPKRAGGRPNAGALLLRKALMNTVAEHGRDTRPYPDGPLLRVVDLEVVRSAFYRDYPAEGPKAKNQAFNRALLTAKDHSIGSLTSPDGKTVVWLLQPSPPGMPGSFT